MATTINQTGVGPRAFDDGGAAMSSSSFTFRCPECRKLLAAARSRVGTMVVCPKCQADLVVPIPSEVEKPRPTGEASSGPVQVGSSSGYRDPSAAAGVGGQAIFLPIRIEDDPLSLRPESSPRPHKIPDRPGGSTSRTPTSDSGSTPAGTAAGSSRPPTQESPTIGGQLDSIHSETVVRDPQPRRNDVVLPRTAVVLWSFVMLLALVFAFAAGVLAGHYLWRPAAIGVERASSAATAAGPAPLAAPAKGSPPPET